MDAVNEAAESSGTGLGLSEGDGPPIDVALTLGITSDHDVFSACPLCAQPAFRLVFNHPDCGQVVECARCGLRYTKARRLPSWPQCRRAIPGALPEMIMTKEADQTRDFDAILDRLGRLDINGRLLEVGSMTGHFLARARERGFETVGVEPDPWAADHSRETFGLDVRDTFLEESHFEPGSFSVVAMLHVMEHLTDPKTTLREVNRVLRPGGVLVVEIPIIDSLVVRALGPRHRHYVFDHTLFMTRDTCTKFLNGAGFWIARCELTGRRIRLSRLTAVLRRSLPSSSGLLNRLLHFGGLENRVLHINVRDVARFYAIKL